MVRELRSQTLQQGGIGEVRERVTLHGGTPRLGNRRGGTNHFYHEASRRPWMGAGRTASTGTKSILNTAVLRHLRRRCARWGGVRERAAGSDRARPKSVSTEFVITRHN